VKANLHGGIGKIERHMKLMSIKNELQTEPIALSCRFFNVTNGFLNSVIIQKIYSNCAVTQTWQFNLRILITKFADAWITGDVRDNHFSDG